MVDSSTSTTARRRLRDRDRRWLGEPQDLDPEVRPEGEDDDGQQGDDDEARRERQALARRRDRPRDGDDRRLRPCRRHARGATGRGPRPGRARGTARSCAGSPWCRPRRAVPCSRRARGRRGSGPGSSCRVRPGRGRRPCARGRRRAAPGRLGAGSAADAAAGVRAVDPDRPLQLLPRRHPSSPSRPSSGPPAAGGSSRRRTWRAFEPSNAPM